MESSKNEIGIISEVTSDKYVIKINEQTMDVAKNLEKVFVPQDLQLNDKVKMIIVNGGVRHIEKISNEEALKPHEPEKEVKKITRRIKADQFFSVYDKGYAQKVYMYKVGDNEFRGKAHKK